jgi:hypothetical protein
MRQTNKIITLSTLLFGVASIVGFPQEVKRSSAATEGVKISSISVPVDGKVLPANLRCGMDALFLALGFLEGEIGRTRYGDVAKSFPNVEQEGTTLNAIGIYLKKQGFSCCFELPSGKILATMTANSVAFLLQEREPISHVVLLHRKGKNDFQVFDTTQGTVKNMTLAEAGKQGSFALFAAKNAADIPLGKTFVAKHGLSIMLLFVGLSLLVFSLKIKKRGNNKNSKPINRNGVAI